MTRRVATKMMPHHDKMKAAVMASIVVLLLSTNAEAQGDQRSSASTGFPSRCQRQKKEI